ncbi:MAG: 4-hydroxy-tetrahydrodipicolinate reductase [Proteobacteria bacterium]|nr:MAG: 4-hydroxy-tetrahydrodipicolinate reductase [Pseudomonadota bacterium]
MADSIQVIISGASGRMGQRLLKVLSEQEQITVVAGLVSADNHHLGKPLSVLSNNREDTAPIVSDLQGLTADVVIDFSQASAFNAVIDYCVMSETALVSGTTGLSQAQFDRISQAGYFIPVLWAANFSLNIQIINNLLQVFKQFNHQASYRIKETHHQHKIDAPSGTAISLAQSLSSSQQLTVVADNKFLLGEINIESVRQAEVPGTHLIQCDFPNERISIEHVAKSGDLFAEGAVSAAMWLAQQDKGVYDLNAILLA